MRNFERFIFLELLKFISIVSIKFEPIFLFYHFYPISISGAAISLNMWTFYCLLIVLMGVWDWE
jgi:hypothetical protein